MPAGGRRHRNVCVHVCAHLHTQFDIATQSSRRGRRVEAASWRLRQALSPAMCTHPKPASEIGALVAQKRECLLNQESSTDCFLPVPASGACWPQASLVDAPILFQYLHPPPPPRPWGWLLSCCSSDFASAPLLPACKELWLLTSLAFAWRRPSLEPSHRLSVPT